MLRLCAIGTEAFFEGENMKKIKLSTVSPLFEYLLDGLSWLLKTLCGCARSIKEEILADVEAVKSRDPAAKNGVEIVLLYSGVHALLAYRVSHKLQTGEGRTKK